MSFERVSSRLDATSRNPNLSLPGKPVSVAPLFPDIPTTHNGLPMSTLGSTQGTPIYQSDKKLGVQRTEPPARTGDYNPMTNSWNVAPKDARYHGESGQGQSKARVPLPPHIGRYDPVRMEWITPPVGGPNYYDREKRQHVSKLVPFPTRIGKYNPLTCKWVIPPRHPLASQDWGSGMAECSGWTRFDRGVKFNPEHRARTDHITDGYIPAPPSRGNVVG
mmetsp:Transcript_3741/g.4181  ORF Transcript_3741/g.4181 Transcript_3741/m.4181 type:complete len:220 (+) Transcript_3741:193-852(+)|eukprot:CAMPEP_0197855022 /NCGR_PEP_ID=MMETSP1438-20131217/25814_1 /TAXON_ID=1461541 /ORGANISM="Pterosperma sp., Strain CCMP1384" /LENGTH=219 /DNA_ID=CAMNT_0043469987 /DNA_START=192 /DNA_END=851 /DNA_ORIENTATION=-